MPDNRIEELKRRVQVDPASIAFAALAEEYRRAGRFEDAIAICRAGLLRHPAYLSARVTLGRALVETGRFDEARQELQLVLRSAPENLAAIRALAEIHDRVGHNDDPSASEPATPPADAGAAAAAVPAPGTPPPPIALAPIPAPPISAPLIPAVPIPAPPIPAPPIPAAQIPAPPIAVVPIPARPIPEPAIAPPTPTAAIPLASVQPTVPAPRPDQPAKPIAMPPSSAGPAAVRVPRPDEAAVPALEAFLAAICAAKSSGRPPDE